MALMNLNIDGVLTVEKVVVPADGITVLSHSLFRGEKIIARHNGDELTRGQDFIPDRIDERLYFQKNVCLFTALKILNESLFGQEIEVEYFACGDYINAEIWNEYPSSASLKQSLASKVDNSDFTKEMKRIDDDVNAEATARKEADNTLQDNINIEANLRIAADDDLQASINDEAVTRKTADDNLQAAINAEATDRQSADSAIRADLENETNLRLVGDSNLQTQISDLKTKFESFVPGLTYKVVSALPTADILNDVIYLVPADSTGSQNVYDEYIYIDGNWELIGTTATTQAITVDSALSETSTNPVQNRVINEALKGKQDCMQRGLVTNSATFMIDITKRNRYWYCPIKFRYIFGTKVNEIDFVLTDKLFYSVTIGRNNVESITYTVDNANVRIGIKFNVAMYGTHVVSIPSECAIINALTNEAFTGIAIAELKQIYGINIDTALSSTSENPVQNKVIAAEISTLKSKAYSEEIKGYTIQNSSCYTDPGSARSLYKKNGIAFVSLTVLCVSPSDGGEVFVSGLPPAAIWFYFTTLAGNNANGLDCRITPSGALLMSGGTKQTFYRLAFSYPIAE